MSQGSESPQWALPFLLCRDQSVLASAVQSTSERLLALGLQISEALSQAFQSISAKRKLAHAWYFPTSLTHCADGANSYAPVLKQCYIVCVTEMVCKSASGFKTREEFEVRSLMLHRRSITDQVQKAVVGHIETTLARSLFNCDELYVSHTTSSVLGS